MGMGVLIVSEALFSLSFFYFSGVGSMEDLV